MSPTIFAVEIDADWLKAIGGVLLIFLTAGSYAFVRMWRVKHSEGRADGELDLKRHSLLEELETKREGLAWNRIQDLINKQDLRIKDQDAKIESLIDTVSKYRIEAADAKIKAEACELREKESMKRELALKRRIQSLEDKLGGSGEHAPLEE